MATILNHDVREIVVGLPGSSGDNSIVDVLAVVTTDLRNLTVKPVGEAVDGMVDLVGIFGRDGCEDGDEDGDAQGGDEGGYHAGAGDVGVGCYPFLRRAVEGGAGTTHRSTIHDDSLSERCDDGIQEES